MLSIGIVGLPNVGKSTLFNALTKSHSADAANYPFCTIEPNTGIVEVPDTRLKDLATLYPSERIIPTAIEFVDIAGLVAGAAEGAGLGNKFLANIREVDAIVHVIRDFENPDIQHVAGKVDPSSDRAVIDTELQLADLATMERKTGEAERRARTGDASAKAVADTFAAIRSALSAGSNASTVQVPDDLRVQTEVRDCHLLTRKPVVYAVNIAASDLSTFDPAGFRTRTGLPDTSVVIPVSAQLESELATLSPEDTDLFLADLSLTESSLNPLIRGAYRALSLHTFFTVGPKEARAWTVPIGATAPEAAGVIHSDFQTKFIKADIIQWSKLLEAGSESAARDKGWIQSCGKDYVLQDGDTCTFKHG